MLSTQSINSQYPLAADLDRRGILVMPIEGSILSELASASYTDDAIFHTYQAPYKFDTSEFKRQTEATDPVLGRVRHNDLMEAVVERVYTAVSNYLLYTRTTVVPMINEFIEGIRVPLENAGRANTLDLEIVTHNLPLVYTNPRIIEEVSRAKDIPFLNEPLGVGIPTQNYETVQELIKTGVASVDAQVEEMCKKIGPDKLVTIVNDIFSYPSVSTSLIEYLRRGPEYPIIAWLVARKHWDKVIEGTSITLSQYTDRMVKIRDQAAKQILDALYVFEMDQKAGILIKSYGKPIRFAGRTISSQIVVNQPVYEQWLKSGGDNNALFGSVVSGNGAIRVEDIDKNLSQYQEAWQNYMTVNATIESMNRFTACKNIVRAEMGDTLAAASHDVAPPQNRQTIMAAFEEELAKTKEDDLRDVPNWVMRLITKSIFAHTDAYCILHALHQVRMANPKMSADEAADIAGALYVADWISAQFKIVGLQSPVVS